MKNRRLLISLLLTLLVGGAVFGLCYWVASRVGLATQRHASDDLAWLGREFHLTDGELARIRVLHEGYLPNCQMMCVRIDAKNRELAELLQNSTNLAGAIEQKLAETATLRAECQAQMLRHFQAVAGTMPDLQGRRYLAEMHRLTLGLPDPQEARPGTHHDH